MVADSSESFLSPLYKNPLIIVFLVYSFLPFQLVHSELSYIILLFSRPKNLNILLNIQSIIIYLAINLVCVCIIAHYIYRVTKYMSK
jgi:ABC-type xylose transport system permease subunit